MIVVRLEDSTYLPDDVIEGYSSMIWTERYLPAGEFELRTPLIEETRATLPEDSLIGLTDSDEVMVVETHEIDRDESGAATLVVKGRSFETGMEQRYIPWMEGYRKTWKMQSTYPDYGAAIALIWDTIINPTASSELTAAAYAHDIKNNIANVRVSQRVSASTPFQEWWLEAGELYPKVLEFLARSGYGIRNRRPINDVPGTQMMLSSTGALQVDPAIVNSALWIEVYNGQDRSKEQTVNPAVEFSYGAGHLLSPKYLFSSKNFRNVAEVTSSVGSVLVYSSDSIDPNISGRSRRTLYVDGGDAGTATLAQFTPAMVQKGEIELKKHNREAAIDAAISVSTPFKYGTDYGLGDKVTVTGEFGFSTTMMVHEYIRTETEDGDVGYPGLSLPV